MTDRCCYFCGKPATSKEHVPPKALFPKQKDSPDKIDYRKNLVTVPSCDLHNSSKSKDDEYLLYVLTMSLPSNTVAKNQFLSKVRRAYEQRPGLLNRMASAYQSVTVHDRETGEWSNTVAVQTDHTRLLIAFEHIARAIHFHETGSVWVGTATVVVEFTLSLANSSANASQEALVAELDGALQGVPLVGSHPAVFAYQSVGFSSGKVIRMHFYGDSKVVVALQV